MICNHDCLHCPFSDCINEQQATREERKESKDRDTEILLSRGIIKPALTRANADDETKRKRHAYYQSHKEAVKERAKARYWNNREELKADALRRYHNKKR